MFHAVSPVSHSPRFGALMIDPSAINTSGWAASPEQAAFAEKIFNEKSELSPVYVLEQLGYDVLVKAPPSAEPGTEGWRVELHAIATDDPDKKSVYCSSAYTPQGWENDISNIQKFWGSLDRFGFRFLASLASKKA